MKRLWILLMIGLLHPAIQAENPYVIHQFDTDKKMVTLTFDDGPHPRLTPKILEVLDRHQLKATFFVVGEQIERFPALLDRIYREGHAVGNHSFSHKKYTSMTTKARKKDFAKTQALLFKHTKTFPKFFRPPYGRLNEAAEKELKPYVNHVLFWSIDSRDSFSVTTSKDIVKNVLTNLKPGGVILCHDQNKRTVGALEEIIIGIKKKGYRIVSLDTLYQVSKQ